MIQRETHQSRSWTTSGPVLEALRVTHLTSVGFTEEQVGKSGPNQAWQKEGTGALVYSPLPHSRQTSLISQSFFPAEPRLHPALQAATVP